MAIKIVTAEEYKRGMMVAEDILDNGKVIVDKENLLSGVMIAMLRKRNIGEIKIIVKEIPKAEEGEAMVGTRFKIDEVKEAIEDILLYDPETDEEMKFLKTVMSLGRSKDTRAIEALDFVINYVELERARELAAEGLISLKSEDAIPSLILCMKDELPKVRNSALKYLSRDHDDYVVERLIASMDNDTIPEAIEDIYKVLASYPPQMVKEVCENLVDNGSPNNKIQAKEVINKLKLNS